MSIMPQIQEEDIPNLAFLFGSPQNSNAQPIQGSSVGPIEEATILLNRCEPSALLDDPEASRVSLKEIDIHNDSSHKKHNNEGQPKEECFDSLYVPKVCG